MGEYFTTHDIALMLNVTRVTVRNWIIKGRLSATTTPGGHRRISRQELIRFMEANNYDPEIIREYELTRRKRFVYCWEYHHKGFVNLGHRHQCENCVVFASRAQRCYILRQEGGHLKVHCRDTCEECGYYNKYFSKSG
ncbi:MAG: helix-turn-helix domain-containing protein [Deltaproteobacteria bacterium]|nr:helix-turn-helix domain-containing protein [Deltaproteobacteria bacterium]